MAFDQAGKVCIEAWLRQIRCNNGGKLVLKANCQLAHALLVASRPIWQQATRTAIIRAPRWFVLTILLAGCDFASPLPPENELWTVPTVYVGGHSETKVEVYLPIWSPIKSTIVGLETNCPCLKPTNLPIDVGPGPPTLVSLQATLPTAFHSARTMDFQVVFLSGDGRVGRTKVICLVLPEAATTPSRINDTEDTDETAVESD